MGNNSRAIIALSSNNVYVCMFICVHIFCMSIFDIVYMNVYAICMYALHVLYEFGFYIA